MSGARPRGGCEPAASLAGVSLRRGGAEAIASVDLEVPAGGMVGVVGPDGVGKSSLLSIVAGARAAAAGRVRVLGEDLATPAGRRRACGRIAFMPQGLGRNLYPTLSVAENLDFFASLFGRTGPQRRGRIGRLTQATGLQAFLDRPAGQLSGGMRQKLGLCCVLLHDPDLLVLDEPTTGIDPLSRRHFWELVAALRGARPEVAVLVATSLPEEAGRFDRIVAMDGGRILAAGSPDSIRARCGGAPIEEALASLLPPQRRARSLPPPRPRSPSRGPVAIAARDLTRRFGAFVAVDRVSLEVRRGEVFGFLGSNGSGKTTVMRMLAGLLPPSGGEATVLGGRVGGGGEPAIRGRIGYMPQSFPLHRELTARGNLRLHARLRGVPAAQVRPRVEELAGRFGLAASMRRRPDELPLGVRKRLSLAAALVHRPELVILDEPTSGVDPAAREAFWSLLLEAARRDGTTVFLSTHLMAEAERCDRISFMHAGRILATGDPRSIAAPHGGSLDEAFVAAIAKADGGEAGAAARAAFPAAAGEAGCDRPIRRFAPSRALAYARRDLIELRRDPVRAFLALLGGVLLMAVIGYGINMDVEELPYAVLDRDGTVSSRDYAASLSGSRFFLERPPLADHGELDRRMRSGELALAIEIPGNFARDLDRGVPTAIGAWADGSIVSRAETVRGYAEGIHRHWLQEREVRRGEAAMPPISIETRFLYNPEVRSLPAIVPAVLPLLLLMIPAMLAALSVVREKELGSIVNFRVTPVTRSEFLAGKMLPCIGVGAVNFLAMTLLATAAFGVPLKGSLAGLAAAAAFYIAFAAAFGLLVSAFVRTQTAAILAAMMATMIPATQYSGMIHPVSSLEGLGRFVGEVHPASAMVVASRGAFGKALGFGSLLPEIAAIAAAVPAAFLLAVALVRKQER